jgi:hypothetical protein
MNLSLVVIADPQNPSQFKGVFSVQFTSTDIANNTTPVSAPSSAGFNLTIGGNGAYPNCLYYMLWAPYNGLNASNNVGCPPQVPASEESAGGFVPGTPNPVGSISGNLQWDGSNGIFTADFVLPMASGLR